MTALQRGTGPIRLEKARQLFRNLGLEELIERCLQDDRCELADNGAIVAYSDKYTGRTPKDKHIVRDGLTESKVWWANNGPISPETFDAVSARVRRYAEDGRPLYVVDAFAGADPAYRISVRFILERPYHALFIRQLLIRPTEAELAQFEADWTVVDMGKLSLVPGEDGLSGDACIALDFSRREVMIAGTQYAGEIKKSVFTIMNFLLPERGALSMHCSANLGRDGDTALFFGLSGTGKTTLSADPERDLIGDDETGWTDEGVFNVEGGCYAKCIGLSRDGEPEIFAAIRRGSVLENVVLHGGTPDYADDSITENTRAAYPIEFMPRALTPSVGGHPKNIIFLTADAMGVLPPIARLTTEQALYYFLNGYTAKVAGTEAGVKEPQAAFSACFGAPFLPLPPRRYSELLRQKLERHGSRVWLLNTGWTGGPYGTGHRIELAFTRSMLHAVFAGDLDGAEYRTDAVFGIEVPVACPNVPEALLNPRETWPDLSEYDRAAAKLKAMFDTNYAEVSGY